MTYQLTLVYYKCQIQKYKSGRHSFKSFKVATFVASQFAPFISSLVQIVPKIQMTRYLSHQRSDIGLSWDTVATPWIYEFQQNFLSRNVSEMKWPLSNRENNTFPLSLTILTAEEVRSTSFKFSSKKTLQIWTSARKVLAPPKTNNICSYWNSHSWYAYIPFFVLLERISESDIPAISAHQMPNVCSPRFTQKTGNAIPVLAVKTAFDLLRSRVFVPSSFSLPSSLLVSDLFSLWSQ